MHWIKQEFAMSAVIKTKLKCTLPPKGGLHLASWKAANGATNIPNEIQQSRRSVAAHEQAPKTWPAFVLAHQSTLRHQAGRTSPVTDMFGYE